MDKKNSHFSLTNTAWNLWCIGSIIGIWPRFIEPRTLFTTHLNLPLSSLPKDLEGLRIVHISDLHWGKKIDISFLKRLSTKINRLNPDILLFGGDFLCYSQLERTDELKKFLSSLKARFGCYCVLGNHDYAKYVSIDENGNYAVNCSNSSSLKKGFRKLLSKTPDLTGKMSPDINKVAFHQNLLDAIKETPFTLLHNESRLIPIKDTYLNVCGLGEYMLGKSQPSEAFQNYDRGYPGIVLSHNPDSIKLLTNFPSDVILCGHTHGGQVNLPWFRRKFLLLEDKRLVKGLKKVGEKLVYINRGIGSVMQFRWFSPPEILLLTLKRAHD